jgi:sulfoxide reductase heme-binding subunit YedZ
VSAALPRSAPSVTLPTADAAPPARAPRERRPPRRRSRSVGQRLVWLAVMTVALAPGAYLAWQLWLAWTGQPHTLGEEPVERLEHETGTLAIRFLVLTLLVTPLRALTGWNAVAPYRRPLGLLAFGYTTAHLVVYAALDLELRLGEVVGEIVERPFITVGFLAWLLLVPLALTSTTGAIRRLGGKQWRALHRLTYAVIVLAIVHFWWGQKKDVTEPAVYAAVVALLLGWRIWRTRRDVARGSAA